MKNQPSREKLGDRGKAGRVGPGRQGTLAHPKGRERTDAPRAEPSHRLPNGPKVKPQGEKQP